MTLRQYLAIMALGTALAWSAVVLMVTMIDPTETQAVVIGAFYFSLLLALTGTFSVMGFISRISLLGKRLNVSRQVAVSFRQAVMLAIVATTALFLQSQAIFRWWNAALMLAFITVIESFFVTAGRQAEGER